jgi:hypothetical protein
MKYSERTFGVAPEVLKRKLGGELFDELEIDSTAFTNGKLAAGSVVAADGKKSSGDGSDAYGITLNDAYADSPNVAVVRAFATINTANTTATSADRAAMPNLVFE